MGLLILVLLFLTGALSAPAFLTAKIPAAKPMLEKVEPHSPWIGAVSLVFGLWGLVNLLLHLGVMFYSVIWGLIYLASIVSLIGLGFLLAFPLLSQFLFSKNAEAAAKGEAIKLMLVGYREKLGLLAMGLACLMLVLMIYTALTRPSIPAIPQINVTINK